MEVNVVLEWIATIAGIICVFLQSREKIWAWPFGIVSVTILAYIFFGSKLYSDFILHIIFLILNIYGWWFWTQKSDTLAPSAPITSMSGRHWALSISLILVGTVAWGYVMDTQTDASYAYVDAFTTSGSLVAQYLLAKKVLQNWLIWIVVDVVAIGVYILKDLHVVAFLFAVFLLLSMYGWYNWRSELEAARERSIFSLADIDEG